MDAGRRGPLRRRGMASATSGTRARPGRDAGARSLVGERAGVRCRRRGSSGRGRAGPGTGGERGRPGFCRPVRGPLRRVPRASAHTRALLLRELGFLRREGTAGGRAEGGGPRPVRTGRQERRAAGRARGEPWGRGGPAELQGGCGRRPSPGGPWTRSPVRCLSAHVSAFRSVTVRAPRPLMGAPCVGQALPRNRAFGQNVRRRVSPCWVPGAGVSPARR